MKVYKVFDGELNMIYRDKEWAEEYKNEAIESGFEEATIEEVNMSQKEFSELEEY